MRRSKRPQETGRRSQARKKQRSKRYGLTAILAVGVVVILGFLSFELWNRHVQKELIAERQAVSSQAESKKWSREKKQLSEKEASLAKEQKEAQIDAKARQSLAKKRELAEESRKQELQSQKEASLAQSKSESESLAKKEAEHEHDEASSSAKQTSAAFTTLVAQVAGYQELPAETVKKGTLIGWYNECKANDHDVQFANTPEVAGKYNALDVCHTCKKYQLLTVEQ